MGSYCFALPHNLNHVQPVPLTGGTVTTLATKRHTNNAVM